MEGDLRPVGLDLVCFYCDLGRPYMPLIDRMVSSGRRAMPGVRAVLLTRTPSPELAAPFDLTIDLGPRSLEEMAGTLCYDRARATASWMAQTGRPAVLADPDVEFRAAPPDLDADVGLLWRRNKRDQPVNTGVILAKPGHREFWQHYVRIVANLPKSVRYWWCDQLGFALLTGIMRSPGDLLTIDGARVQLLDALDHCATPETATPNAWAIHYKGARKGDGWEKVFPNRARSGDGKSSPVSV